MFPPIDTVGELRDGDTTPLRDADLRASDLTLMAFHPLGTARADARPDHGVVDGDLKLHDADGVYVADGSVVPSSLGVNPQITIMALATRLAYRLLGKRGAARRARARGDRPPAHRAGARDHRIGEDARACSLRRPAHDDSLFALVLLPVALAVIMVSLGLSLTVADFKRVFVFPKGVAIGMANLRADLAAARVRDRRAVRPRAGARGRPRADGRRAGRHDGEPDDPPGQGRHRAVGDDDRDQQPGRGRSPCRSTSALSIDYFDAGVGDDVSMGGIVARVFADHDRAAGDRHVAAHRATRSAPRASSRRVKKVAFAFLVVVDRRRDRQRVRRRSRTTSPTWRSRR